MTKLDTIAEADDARAQYDQFKADDAKKAAIEQVKKYASIPLNQIPRLANAIDPKTGIIYYGDADGEGSGDGNPKMMSMKIMNQPDQKPMLDALTLAGLQVVPHEVKGLFGMTSQYAKVEPDKLAQVVSGTTPPAPGPKPPAPRPKPPAPGPKPPAPGPVGPQVQPTVTPPAPDKKTGADPKDQKRFQELIDKFKSVKKQDDKPVTPPVTPPVAPPGPGVEKKWPTTPAEIKAFQKGKDDPRQPGQKLAVDGLIGTHTYQALINAGYKPPPGFKVTAYKPTGKPIQAINADESLSEDDQILAMIKGINVK